MLRLTTPTGSLSENMRDDIILETFAWCQENLGQSLDHKTNKKSKSGPIIHLYKADNNNKKCFGLYEPEYNRIYLFMKPCKTVSLLIRTIIHEHTHTRQNLKYYEMYDVMFGYHHNPLEVEARRISRDYYRAVFKDIKAKMEQKYN